MLCIRVGGFQPPGQKHKIEIFAGLSKQQREPSYLDVSCNSRMRGSREVTSLVGSGVKPQRILCELLNEPSNLGRQILFADRARFQSGKDIDRRA